MLVGIYSNKDKDKELFATRRIIEALDAEHLEYFVDEDLHSHCESTGLEQIPGLLIIVGGDGTMLSAARKYAASGCLILGINMGRVGFLLQTDVQNAKVAIKRVVSGDYQIQERMMLAADVMDENNNCVRSVHVLNDICIKHGAGHKIVNVGVEVDRARLPDIFSDGLILSTPTGTTGNSISAGASILQPTLNIMQVTPICSHSICAKSTVISGDSLVKLTEKRTGGRASMFADGINVCEVGKGGHINIRKADFKARFVCTDGYDFFSTLRGKLAEWNLQ